MKTKVLFSFLFSFSFYLLSSQVPQGFNYQAIARDASGNPITNYSLPVRITIQSDSLGGTTFWIEEHGSVTTNSFGLFTLILGKGVRQSGSTMLTFIDIDWSATPKFIKTEIDYSGWKNMGSSRFWAVPYSLVAGSINGTLKKLAVTGETINMDEALFEVKNKNGQTVFAVYNEGVRVYVDDGVAKSSTKGGFAIGGFGTVKAPSQEYFRVTPDSTRVYVDDGIAKGATKGGFAIGGFGTVKGTPQNYLVVNSDSIRMYINDTGAKTTKGGFAIGGFDVVKGKGLEYMRITEDSARINMKEAAKGSKGGFAIGGFSAVKGSITQFTSLTPDNYFIGHEAGMSNTTGLYNSFFGYNAGRSNTSGGFNTFIGHKSGYSNKDGDANLFIGDSAGYQNTSGYANVFLGPWAGQDNTTGYYNVSLGYLAGANSTAGWQNVNLGVGAGRYSTTGNRNIFVGVSAGMYNTEGSMNVFVGNFAGLNCTKGETNVYLGAYAGRYNTTGHRNVFLGYMAGRDETSSNKLYIASNPYSPLLYGDLLYQKLTIAGDSTSNTFNRTFFVNGDAGGMYAWSNDSDKKLKHDIVTIPDALQKVLKLRGVNFLWNQPVEGMDGLQMGFIGQEAVDIVPEVVSVSNDHYSMQYAPVTALLVEGMKAQQKQIDSQKKEIEDLKALVNTLIANQTGQGNK